MGNNFPSFHIWKWHSGGGGDDVDVKTATNSKDYHFLVNNLSHSATRFLFFVWFFFFFFFFFASIGHGGFANNPVNIIDKRRAGRPLPLQLSRRSEKVFFFLTFADLPRWIWRSLYLLLFFFVSCAERLWIVYPSRLFWKLIIISHKLID